MVRLENICKTTILYDGQSHTLNQNTHLQMFQLSWSIAVMLDEVRENEGALSCAPRIPQLFA